MSAAALSPEPARPRRPLRFAGLLLAGLVLMWAWGEAGMPQIGKLWTHRTHAADYLLGTPIDASTLAARHAEAERVVRIEFQDRARAGLEARYAADGRPTPSLMQLMTEAKGLAEQRIAAMNPEDFEALVREHLAQQGDGGRRGGYFPPELDPHSIFGNFETNARPADRAARLAALFDRLHPWLGNAWRWSWVAVAGDGYTGKLCETLAIAIWGTLLAVFAALPASVLGSRAGLRILSSGRGWVPSAMRTGVHFAFRRSFDIARGFNEIVLAMIFVAVLGLGPLPGVLALVIHSYGTLGKVFAEALDTTDIKPIEGVLSTGASPLQVTCRAALPQVMPYIVSQALLRFESNVRGATILGVVGAGGIGQLLMDKFGAYKFPEVATMMIIIIVVVTLIDSLCGHIMRRFT